MPLKGKWNKAAGAKEAKPVTTVEDHLKATRQDHLPQAQLLTSCLHRLEKEDLIEAYLRGSFFHGDADVHSDVDLFLVVDPKRLASTYDAFTDYLKKEYTVLVSCHDKLVVDYGGIGFMFLCKDKQGKIFQFDLYMAMKGVRPKNQLNDCMRVLAKDPAYSWSDEMRYKSYMPVSARKFIADHTGGDDRVSRVKYYLTELMVTINIMQKHLRRGQVARALYDNNHAISVSVEMLSLLSNQKSHHWGFYAADKLIKNCAASEYGALRKAARDLRRELTTPVDPSKAETLFEIAKNVVRDMEPKLYAEMAPALEEYERLVLPNLCSFYRPMPGAPHQKGPNPEF